MYKEFDEAYMPVASDPSGPEIIFTLGCGSKVSFCPTKNVPTDLNNLVCFFIQNFDDPSHTVLNLFQQPVDSILIGK